MTSSVFPDLNVWLSMTLRTHVHHASAWTWYQQLPENAELIFCRFSQLGLLRLLTTPAVAGTATMTQREAWAAYDKWIKTGGAVFYDEPPKTEIAFRAKSNQDRPSSKGWADSYLAAFASAASLQLVTFDKALSQRSPRSILLSS